MKQIMISTKIELQPKASTFILEAEAAYSVVKTSLL